MVSIPGKDKIFLFSVASRPPLEPTQLTIQWVPILHPRKESGRSVKLTTHLHLVPRSRMVELYVHSSIRLHGIVLQYIIKYRDNVAFYHNHHYYYYYYY
jgi:hypothetical protein